PSFLFPWAQAERLHGNCVDAIKLYQQYLDSDPPKDEKADYARFNRDECQKVVDAMPKPEPVVVAPPPPPPPKPRWYQKHAKELLTGGSLVGLGVGFVFWSTSNQEDEAAA